MNYRPQCNICLNHFGHSKTCDNNPNKGKHWMEYEDGIGDVRFHLRDSSSFMLKRVQYETVAGDPNGNRSDTSGEFENGNMFHVPNCLWWEVITD